VQPAPFRPDYAIPGNWLNRTFCRGPHTLLTAAISGAPVRRIMIGMDSATPQGAPAQFPIGFVENPGLFVSPRKIQEGVELDGPSIRCGDTSGTPLLDIVSIQLWPFYDSDGPDSGRCDIRFTGGAILRITSMGRSGVITRERDLAYAAFLGCLHAALSVEARARIAFLDGIQGGGSAFIAIAVLFCGPVIVLSLYAAATRGLVWLLGLVPSVVAIGGFSIWYRKRPRPNFYSPDRLPPHVLPRLD
jgi:hypothetical protein